MLSEESGQSPAMPDPATPLRGPLFGLAAFGLYALYDMTIKFLGDDYSPVQILFFAGLFVLPMYLVHLWLDPAGGSLRPVLPGLTMARSVVGLANGVLGAYGFSVLPLAECYAILFLMPLLIALLAVPILGEPLGWPRGLAILAGLVGVLIVLRPGQSPLLPAHLATLAAAALGALNYIIVRRVSGVERPAVLLLYPTLVQFIAVALALPFVWQPMPLAHLGLTALMAVELFIGGFLVVAAYRLAPVVVVAPMQYSQIIWATVLGALIFGEAMDGPTWGGIGLIIAAGLFILGRAGR